MKRGEKRAGRMIAASICRDFTEHVSSLVDFAAVADGNNKNHEALVLDRRDNAVIADAVAPKTFQISGQWMAKSSRVICRSDALAQVAKDRALRFGTKLAQIACRFRRRTRRARREVRPCRVKLSRPTRVQAPQASRALPCGQDVGGRDDSLRDLRGDAKLLPAHRSFCCGRSFSPVHRGVFRFGGQSQCEHDGLRLQYMYGTSGAKCQAPHRSRLPGPTGFAAISPPLRPKRR